MEDIFVLHHRVATTIGIMGHFLKQLAEEKVRKILHITQPETISFIFVKCSYENDVNFMGQQKCF